MEYRFESNNTTAYTVQLHIVPSRLEPSRISQVVIRLVVYDDGLTDSPYTKNWIDFSEADFSQKCLKKLIRDMKRRYNFRESKQCTWILHLVVLDNEECLEAFITKAEENTLHNILKYLEYEISNIKFTPKKPPNELEQLILNSKNSIEALETIVALNNLYE